MERITVGRAEPLQQIWDSSVTDQPEWIQGTAPRVIISAGLGSQHYRKMLRSTENHCAVHCPETWRLFYDVLPTGCPPHAEHQYAFKIEAMRRAVESNIRNLLWMDATCQPVESIEPLWEHIEREGFYIVQQGDAKLGTWTNDYALRCFGIDRDKAMEIPLVYTGLIGLDTHSEVAKAIWDEWDETYRRGAFYGPHMNDLSMGVERMKEWGAKWRGWCSPDPRCEGHRHDESAMSFVLWKLGLKPVENPRGLAHYGIERHVPDYDVVKMREALLTAQEAFGYVCALNPAAQVRKLCR